ncbi:ABC transporter permease [Streptomyces xiaopingdaonensis]|uniref:ABC transporter permease n=1 Tax=Streptomyces xiaopingdaonensis TaxID=1565415 RepID=UPI0002E03CF9|nr:ABC transporter permease [Streptomyces xiaopingdaonensis]
MLRTALRNVLAHKARLLMTVLAVLLGVAFVSGTMVFTSTISQAFEKSSQSALSDVDLSIREDASSDRDEFGGAPPSLDQRALDRVERLDGVASATGIASGFAALADKNRDLVGDGWETRGANYYPSGADKTDPRYPMADGRAPQRGGEVALDEKTAERTGYRVGDTVVMSVDGPVRKERVTGVFRTDDGNVAAGGSLVLFDNRTAQQLFTEPGEYTEVRATAESGVSQAELKSRAEPLLPEGFEAVTGRQLVDDEARMIDAQMSSMKTSMLAFAGIALFVGVFIIVNTFTMLVAQRTKELALLRAVGASRRQVTRAVRFEALAVGFVAAVLGLGAGVGIAAVLRSFAGSLGGMPEGPLVVTGGTVATALLVGMLVTVLAAWLPARRAARIPPVAAMGSQYVPSSKRGLLVRNTLGALLSAAGGALVLFSRSLDDGKMPLAAGAVLLVVGVFVLTPLLSRPLIALSAPVLRLFRVSGKLARLNAVRTPRRTAATASALMIGLTLITGLTVVAGSAQQAIDKMATASLKADYSVSMANFNPLSPEVEQKLSSLDEVTATSPMRSAPIEVGDETRYVTGVDGRSIGELVAVDFTAGSWSGLGDTGKPGVVVDEKTAERNGWDVGSTFRAGYEDGAKQELTVGGVYEGNQAVSGVILDYRVLTPHLAKPVDMQVMAKTAHGADDETKAAIEQALGGNPALLVEDSEDLSESVSQVITTLLNVLYGLLAMAVLVAVLGVVNTLAMSVYERGQEIGMLRAIGLDRRGVKRMVRLESVVISLFGGVLGILLGVFLAWAVGGAIAGEGFDAYEMVLPWDTLGLFLLLSAVVGVLAAVWPARRAARLNMLEAIKSE